MIDLKAQAEKQEKELQTVDIELCRKIKASTEEKYAKYTLKKEIVPQTRWYVEDKNGVQTNLDIGDRIEHIELEQCFDLKNNYIGTVRSIVAELGPKHIKLATPEKYYYLMGEGNRIFEIYKPLSEFEIMEQSDEVPYKIQRNVSIAILIFTLILIVCGFVVT